MKDCRICGEEIPSKRIEAIPGTLVCVGCSEEIGGEYEIEVNIGFTGKAGSLKKTGESITAKVKPKSTGR